MPFKDPEKYREYQKNYQKKVRDKRSLEDKKKKAQYQKDYMKTYDKGERDHKYDTIYNWKRREVIETWYYTFEELYDWYLKTDKCERCNCILTKDQTRKSTTKCLHHEHTTGEFEMIVCHSCNIQLG